MRKLLLAAVLIAAALPAWAQWLTPGSRPHPGGQTRGNLGGISGKDAIVVGQGTAAMATGAIASGACATVVTATAQGVSTTDVIHATFNADPTAVTGYSASANGMLTIIGYPTANTVNFKVCNNTASSITPGAVTLNWQVTR